MTHKQLTVFLGALILVACGGKDADPVAEEPALDNIDQRLSYMVGNKRCGQNKKRLRLKPQSRIKKKAKPTWQLTKSKKG